VLVGPNITGHERALVELSQWMSSTVQYGARHPAVRRLAEKAYATLTAALAEASPLVVGILKDETLVGGVPTRHPTIRTRVGPCLHERGVIVLRLLHGVPLTEVSALVDILTMPPQTVFDRGGVLRLAMDAGFARVQLEELGHDVTAEEREAQRRRAKLRSFFKEVLLGLLARHVVDARIAEHLVELLEHPEIAVTILEEDPAGLAEAAAGLALMVRQEEQRTGLPLAAKLREVFLRLTPPSRDRVLCGFPTLVDEFRAAMAWSFDGFSERELARMAAPAVRAHATELEVVLYALSAAVPHEGTRLSALRLVGLSFFDLPADEAAATDALAILAKPVPEYDSFLHEREVLRPLAAQAFVARTTYAAPRPASIPPPAGEAGVPVFDGRRPVAEVVAIATRTRSFDRFCEGLPAAAAAMLAEGASTSVVGLLRGLASVDAPQWREAAGNALRTVARTSAPQVLRDLDEVSGTVEGEQLEELGTVVRLLAMLAPESVLERLDACENRKMRRIMLDALSLVGPTLLPHVLSRLGSSEWFVVRNAALLAGRVGGAPRDLEVARHHPDFRVRLEVLRALRSMPLEEATMTLVVGYLADTADDVRQQARSLLRGELLGEAAIGELERFVLDDGQPDDLRRCAVDALAQSPRDAAATALFRVLHPQALIESGSTGSVRDHAASALRRSPAPGAKNYFEQGLASSVRRVRRACERAAGTG
jgi:hypothetical protein